LKSSPRAKILTISNAGTLPGLARRDRRSAIAAGESACATSVRQLLGVNVQTAGWPGGLMFVDPTKRRRQNATLFDSFYTFVVFVA
jgi:hypothetical protein